MTFKGMKNVYVCRHCRHPTVTIDLDDGTTPFLTGCTKEGCSGIAESSGYMVQEPLEPTHEWYRAQDDAPLLKHPASKWHHEHGGLFIRPILKIIREKTN